MPPRRRTGPVMPPAPAMRWYGIAELCAGFLSNTTPHVPGRDRIDRQHAIWALAESGGVRYRAGAGIHLNSGGRGWDVLPRWLADMQNGDLQVELPVDLAAANELLQAASALAKMADATGPNIDWGDTSGDGRF